MYIYELEKEEVEDWAATMDGMDIKDWSVEEI